MTTAADRSAPRRWTLCKPQASVVAKLARQLGVDELVATLLVNRGIEDAETARPHLQPKLDRLHDPADLPGMQAATERLAKAIAEDETVLVHGDYDVDGVTGTALLVSLLRTLGGKVEWHVPNRLADGYAFGGHSIARAREVGASVVLSVDNGTSSGETIAQLSKLGIDTVVTDHHEPPAGELPAAVAIVNPKLAGSSYPFRELCGSAVAFKMAWGLARHIGGEERVPARLRDFLVDAMSLVSIATVCDVVPLISENRILARYGLKSLERAPTVGLRALLQATQLAGRPLSAEDIGFQIGPRLNAAGRLGSADLALDLLLCQEPAQAASLARQLEALNQKRRQIEQELSEVAFAEAERFSDPKQWPVLVVAGQGWHSGVIGIVASRLTEAFSRPALVIALDGEIGRGSARSVPGFSVLEAMHGGADLMTRYGGHEQAAGCELPAQAVELLRDAVCVRARSMLADPSLKLAGVAGVAGARELSVDCEISLTSMTAERMHALSSLEPYGSSNPEPVLLSRDLRLAEPARAIGSNADHLLLQVRRGDTVLKALGFGQARRLSELRMGVPLDLVYTPHWNTFRGETKLELRMRDFRVGVDS